jgi:hypothetical protein
MFWFCVSLYVDQASRWEHVERTSNRELDKKTNEFRALAETELAAIINNLNGDFKG